VKILLINQTFYPDVVSTAQHLTDFAVDLAATGHDVTVLTGRRSYSEPHPIYPSEENYKGIKIVRVWPFTFGRRYRFCRIMDFLMVNVSFAWKLLWMPKYDRVVAMTTPPLVGWIALLFARLRNSQFIYWMMDINPDQGITLGWITKGSIRANILGWALEFTLKRSDKIIVLDRFMRARIIRKGAAPEKVETLPPWSHDEHLETISHDKNQFREKYGLNDKFVVMYSGNHSVCHPLDTLLNAAKSLKDDLSVIFVFIGGGDRVREVSQFKDEHRLTNVIQLPYQDRQNLKYSLSAADLHVAVMGEPYIGIVHACKIYGILKIGRPFVYIGPQESHIGDIISEAKLGYHVTHGESDKLVRIIREAGNLISAAREVIQNQEKTIADRYGRKVLSSQLEEMIIQNETKNLTKGM